MVYEKRGVPKVYPFYNMTATSPERFIDQWNSIFSAKSLKIPFDKDSFAQNTDFFKGDKKWVAILILVHYFNKDPDNKDLFSDCENNQLIKLFIKYHIEKGFDLRKTAILTLVEMDFIALQRRANKHMQDDFKSNIHQQVLPRIISTAKSFQTNEIIKEPKPVINNMLHDLENAFAGAKFYFDLIEELILTISNVVVPSEQEFNPSEMDDTKISCFLNCLNSFLNCNGSIEFQKEETEELIESLKAAETSITDSARSIYDDPLLHYLSMLDFFLQCSWLVAVINAEMICPPPSHYIKFLKQFGMNTEEYEDDEEKLRDIIRNMGKSKLELVSEVANLLIYFRNGFKDVCAKVLIPIGFSGPPLIMKAELENKQSENQDIMDINSTSLIYRFPDEFEDLQMKSISEIKAFINELVDTYFSIKSGGNEEEEDNENKAEEDHEDNVEEGSTNEEEET